MVRDYLPLAIDYESLRHPAHLVSLADLVFGVEQYREMEPVLRHIRRHFRAASRVLARRQHHEVLVALEVVVQHLHRGHFFPARSAPRRPYVQKYDFAAQRFERDSMAVQRLQLEIGRSTAGRHRRRGLLCRFRLIRGDADACAAMPAERDQRNPRHHHDSGDQVEDFVLDLHRSQDRAALIAGRRFFSPGCWPLFAKSFSLVTINATPPTIIIAIAISCASLRPSKTRGLIRTNSTRKRAPPASTRYQYISRPAGWYVLRIDHNIANT